MHKKLIFISTIALAIFSLTSCQDFVAVDLGKKAITILAPANNTVSSTYAQLFKWDELKGADRYQLQIAKPNFSAIQQFIADTTVFATQLSYTLQPGIYQWRVRAKNNSSNTEYVTYNISVDTTLNLASQKVVLANPGDNLYSKMLTNTFTWQTMPNANSYVLQILSGGSSVSLQSTASTTLNYTFTTEGTYQWRVYAQNNFGNSSYNTRTINIDTTKPAVPVPVFPSADTITANPIPLKWNCTASADSSHLQISTDSTFTVVTAKDTAIANTANPIVYNFHAAIIGQKYYWKVQAIDKAGNMSPYFTRRRIKRL